MPTTPKPSTEIVNPNTVDAHVIVTPGGLPVDPDGGPDRGFTTQTMDRAEYAQRLANGATPIGDVLLTDNPNATVAITDPLRDTSPAPGVVAVSAEKADEADGDGIVTVQAPKAGFNPPSKATTAQTKVSKTANTGKASAKPAKR